MKAGRLRNGPVNLWYPRINERSGASAKPVTLHCERHSSAATAKSRAKALLKSGDALAPIRIEDVETGLLVDLLKDAH